MSETFLGIYQNLNGSSINVRQLVSALSTELGQDVPASLEVTLENAAFAYLSDTASNALFSVSIDGGVNLSDLPVVGAVFSQSTMLRFDIQVLAAEAPWTLAQLQDLNKKVPSTSPQLPAPTAGIPAGVTAECTLSIGDLSIELDLPFNPSGYSNASTTLPRTVNDSAKISWYSVQKTLGPLTVQQAGVGFDSDSGTLTLYLDAAIAVSSLQVTLEALSFSTPLQNLSPSLSLQGLGFAYTSPGVQLSAAFLNAGGGVYAGSARLEAKAFSIAAIGAYAPDADGNPSIVIYAFASGFAAGPPCLTVEGLAAGFGYNRGLVAPTLDQITGYPLVAVVTGGTDPMASAASAMQSPQQGSGLASALTALNTYFPPTDGQDFAAFGVKFSSFQMVQGFLLLVAVFGHDFSLDLIGLATATFPVQEDEEVSPLALIQIALLASWQPALGMFLLEAQLTSASYVLSPSCHLTGGLALAVWYGDNIHAGDFVFTVGGYNGSFTKPDYYPAPQRLGLSWQINTALTVQGQVYFALCPHLLMAGAQVTARWTDGGLQANFQMGFDVVIGWKPFFYTADIYASLDVSYHGKILGISISLSLEMGASLNVWGPNFSGKASIKVHGIGFTLNFGSASPAPPPPLLWAQFQTSFLPAGGAYWTHAVNQGATPNTATPAAGDLGVVNASQLVLQAASAIPLTELSLPNIPVFGAQIGIAPMQQAIGSISAVATITILATETNDDVTSSFLITPIGANLPVAMWGGSTTPAVNQDSLIANGISGCTIVPAVPPAPGTTTVVEISVLQSDPIDQPSAFQWTAVTVPAVVDEDDAARRAAIAASIPANEAAQQDLLASLGLSNMPIDCAASVAEVFLVAPQILVSSNSR